MGGRVPARVAWTRSVVELDPCALLIGGADGWQRVELLGARWRVDDAACARRFVRRLTIVCESGALELITPPDEGSIAPRAARLPVVSDDALIVDARIWETLADWVVAGGRLGGRTVAELARLACVASPVFAVAIGETVAQLAVELAWERLGPMRSAFGGDLRWLLRPLEEEARESERASEAFIAALSRFALIGHG
jgi:hypothetical protein